MEEKQLTKKELKEKLREAKRKSRYHIKQFEKYGQVEYKYQREIHKLECQEKNKRINKFMETKPIGKCYTFIQPYRDYHQNYYIAYRILTDKKCIKYVIRWDDSDLSYRTEYKTLDIDIIDEIVKNKFKKETYEEVDKFIIDHLLREGE